MRAEGRHVLQTPKLLLSFAAWIRRFLLTCAVRGKRALSGDGVSKQTLNWPRTHTLTSAGALWTDEATASRYAPWIIFFLYLVDWPSRFSLATSVNLGGNKKTCPPDRSCRSVEGREGHARTGTLRVCRELGDRRAPFWGFIDWQRRKVWYRQPGRLIRRLISGTV